LLSHIVENYGKILDEIDYVQTFKALRIRYNQHQDKLKDKDKTTLDRSVSLLTH
jgi:protein phosphatase-4 regulatory subunit 3